MFEHLHLKHRLHEAATQMRETHSRLVERADASVDVIVAVVGVALLVAVYFLGGFE